MSIIYKTNSNETIFIPKANEKNYRSRSEPSYNYEVLLPVVFIILFILMLFLVYAYNNLNLKTFITDHVCCCLSARRKSQRQWNINQFNQHLHSMPAPANMNYYAHTSQFHKSFGLNQSKMYEQAEIFGKKFMKYS